MIEKLNHDFSNLFLRDKEGSTYDGIVEIYGKLNEVIDAVNGIGIAMDIVTENINEATARIRESIDNKQTTSTPIQR